MTGPLSGVTVLDFSTLLPGPMATLLMAEAGAEIIKIERPGSGEDMRHYEPRWGRDSVNFALLNRGKKSLALDLKASDAVSRLTPLIERADVLIEQFRPGVMRRLGLDAKAVQAINPRLIYCSITGYGQTGPKAERAGHDLNYIGDSGLLALSMGTAETPVVPPALIADIAGGAYPAMINILLALRERDRTGMGAVLDIAMADGLFPFMYWAMGNGLAAGDWPVSGGELVTGGSPRYRLYPTSDGRFVAAAPLEEKFWQAFCEAIGLETGLRNDSKDPAATAGAIADIIDRETASHWQSVLGPADCCCTIVATIEEALADPHFRARGLFDATLANAEGATLPALPVPVAAAFREPAGTAKAAPELGADNDELLG